MCQKRKQKGKEGTMLKNEEEKRERKRKEEKAVVVVSRNNKDEDEPPEREMSFSPFPKVARSILHAHLVTYSRSQPTFDTE